MALKRKRPSSTLCIPKPLPITLSGRRIYYRARERPEHPKRRGLRLRLVGAPRPARVRPGAGRAVRALPLRRDPLVTKRIEPDISESEVDV